MTTRKYKPLNLLNNKGVWPEKVAIADAIKEILTIGKCRRPLQIQDFGRYREREWRDGDQELVPYYSVDWYVSHAMDVQRMQVDSSRILESFTNEPWRRESMYGDHYDLFVMEEDMFDPAAAGDAPGAAYAVGKVERMKAAVISTHRIDHIWGMPYSFLKTEVMRQICFMFGVPSPSRSDAAVCGHDVYCTNVCILRPARTAPDDWKALTEDRITKGALCDACTRDLRAFFELVEQEKE